MNTILKQLLLIALLGWSISVSSAQRLTPIGIAITQMPRTVLINSSGSPSTLLSGLVAYYSFESMLVDSTTNGNTLTDHGSVTHDAAGKIGFCSTYASASSQYLSIADNPYFQMGTNSFFIGAWVKLNGNNVIRSGYGNLAVTGYYFSMFQTSYFYVLDGASNQGLVGGLANWNDGAWHYHLVVVDRIQQTLFYYVDNVLQNTASLSAVGSVNNSLGFQIGAMSGIYFSDGSFDEYGVWGRIPTSTERFNLFNGTNGNGSGTTYPFLGFLAPTNRFILFVGDSIMAGYTNWTPAVGGGPSGITTGDIARMIKTNSGSKYVGTNYGIAGKTVNGISLEIPIGLNNSPDLVVMEGAINDLQAGSNFSQQSTNYDRALATCKLYGLHLFVENVWPSPLASWQAISNYNVSLGTWVSTNTGVSLIDIHNLVADSTGTNMLPALTFDLTHPTVACVDFHSKVVWTNLVNYYGQ